MAEVVGCVIVKAVSLLFSPAVLGCVCMPLACMAEVVGCVMAEL